MIKVYMDESGTHDGSPVVSVSAFCGKPREWQRWTKAWNVAKSPIKVFHSVDCQNLAGEFAGWDEAERDALVIRVLETIKSHKLVGLCAAINMKDFNEAMKDRADLADLFGTPYMACFQWVVMHVIELMEKTKNNQQIAFFHEQNDFQGAALDAFSVIKERRKAHTSPMTIAFAPKDKYPPLQAADILAYEANKLGRNVRGKRRRSLKALGSSVSIEGYDKQNMPDLVRRLSINLMEIKTFGRVVTFLPDDQ